MWPQMLIVVVSSYEVEFQGTWISALYFYNFNFL